MKATLIDSMGTDLTAVNAARVSFGKKSEWEIGPDNPWDERQTLLKEQDIKLINYLAAHKHTSPFGHCFASFHVKAPIFVARQLVKHKFLRWNEISRRYVDEEPEFYEPKVWRAAPVNKKQGSSTEMWDEFGDPVEFLSFGDQGYTDIGVHEVATGLYNNMIKGGVAPEMARMVLPQSMFTEWYWSGSLDAWADMCNLRCYPDAQLETKIVADQIDEIMGELYPVSWKALRNK